MSLPWSSKSLKGTPVSADELMILDSADANPSTTNKRITVGSLPPQETFTWTGDHDAVGFELLNVGRITISNPADTFQYLVTPSAIALDVTTTLPLLTNSDTFLFEAFAQSLTNKTINESLNSIVQTAPTTGEYLRDNGTKFVASPIINTDLPTGIDPMKIALADGDIIVGDAVNQGSGVTMSGNATIDNTGVLTIVDNSITNAKTATFTTTKITTTNKALLNSSIIYGDQNNSFGAFYQDIEELAAPVAPAVGTRRMFVDQSTGEISVRTSSATTVSLESPSATGTNIFLGTLDAPNFQYIDTAHNWAGNDNGSNTLGITLTASEPVGTTYTFTYTITTNDLPTGMSGLIFNVNSFMFTGQAINNDAVSSNVSIKVFLNDAEIDVGGSNTTLDPGEFGPCYGYTTDVPATVGDIVQVKMWTNGSILVNLEKFGVYVFPIEIEVSAKSVTVLPLEFDNDEFIADLPLNVTVASKTTRIFPEYNVTGSNGLFNGIYANGNPRMILKEIAVPDDGDDQRVSISGTFTNRMDLPTVNLINNYRLIE